ncbi:DUF4115 domain-containing protein [Thalassotalea euphylliae]|uniref:DUF4115 domain-containing protein n=1 Tax=Thalassotalea euphylliae TaxID=1655234 RepID=A0A3E0TNI9_9GAMM|nr:RodZ domain-containing protein [Thalassotalea euphylliae]REL25830.1 DUF4115 domain-containing protein [Thalassotalea euphylliae]
MSKTSTELSEDIEVIGPGKMLAEARMAMGLSQQQVAEQLNFRPALVEKIEQEIFDSKLPDTFNRGYLKNYAKLVGVDEHDVLASYEMLGVAAKQRTELQSFSKITEKEAQHSRLMWLSYFILAALIASTVIYYLQDASNDSSTSSIAPVSDSQTNTSSQSSDVAKTQSGNAGVTDVAGVSDSSQELISPAQAATIASQASQTSQAQPELNATSTLAAPVQETLPANIEPNERVQVTATDAEVAQIPATAVFSFAGDCWVNIYDGTGERIAWGIKKAGYVMQLKGTAPFKVTVGKPELVAIDFNGESIDMSKYNVGNIAKFSLPESS